MGSFLKHRANGVAPLLRVVRGLDADSSGIVLFGIGAEAERALAPALRDAAMVLHAVVSGGPTDDRGELVDFLRKQRVGRREVLVRVHAGGKKAVTRFRVIERRAGQTHLELEPVRGSVAQVRAQLASWPVARLHLRRISFVDPADGRPSAIEAPLPEDFLAPPATEAPSEPRYVVFYKPYGVLCQFTTTDPNERSLADYALPPGVYPVGRLDKDSEGLLLLTSDGGANARLSDPAYAKEKCYWVQVERVPTDEALAALAAGVTIRGYTTRPCRVRRLEPAPDLPERDPPIRTRREIPTCWLEVILTEGKNRQVRRMTAAIGHPTLRLVRARVDRFELGELGPGEAREVDSF